jgi:putative ubiquitin-RnfH superfamily antitoxin RatB of RatAB toxin-antitoxin module
VKITVVYALPRKAWSLVLDLPPGATAGDAMQAVMAHAEMSAHTGLSVGINGRVVGLDEQLEADDRVEIYRPLTANPKEIRRNRAQRKTPRP